MAKGLNQVHVGIQFDANTNQARTAIKSLQTELTKLANSTTINVQTSGAREAKSEILELKQHLSQAINIDTGRLD